LADAKKLLEIAEAKAAAAKAVAKNKKDLGERFTHLDSDTLEKVHKKVKFIDDIIATNELEGASANMFDKLSGDVVEGAMKGESATATIEKKLNHGKQLTYKLAKASKMIDADTKFEDFEKDDHKFWASDKTDDTTDDDSETNDAQTDSFADRGAEFLGLY